MTVCEKNEKAGKKIYITGKGRCNVTNNTDPEGVLANTVHNARFLKGAAYALPPERLMSLLGRRRAPAENGEGNRVFPVSEKASDVTKCLETLLQKCGRTVSLRFGGDRCP